MSRALEKRILREAQGLVGLSITGIRYMTSAERHQLFVDHRGIVLTLSDGTDLYPMADDEQNDVGVLIARSPDGRESHLSCLDE
jgi:hypothetical protein